MDELTKNFLEHYRATHPGMPIKYFDASEGLPISAFNPIEEPAFPPKTVYQDFPRAARKDNPMSDRDTHFAGFAKLLIQDIAKVVDFFPTYEDQLRTIQSGVSYDSTEVLERLETLIAQRAYDLVEHALSCNNGAEAHYWPDEPMSASVHYKRQLARATKDVPDLTTLPPAAPGSAAG